MVDKINRQESTVTWVWVQPQKFTDKGAKRLAEGKAGDCSNWRLGMVTETWEWNDEEMILNWTPEGHENNKYFIPLKQYEDCAKVLRAIQLCQDQDEGNAEE